MNELCFAALAAPVARLHTEPFTHPFAPALERAMLVTADAIAAQARRTLAGEATPATRLRSGFGGQAPVAACSRPAPAAAAAPAAPVQGGGEFITMPFGDLTVSEGKLLRWVREVGDAVKAGEHVADIETDKAVVEIEAPRAGVLAERLAEEGATVKMGAPIGVVR